MNKMLVIHMIICFIYSKIFESGILVSGIPKVWEDTDGCANQYRCDLGTYLMNVLSYLYGIVIYREINAPGHVNNFVDVLDATEKRHLKGKMEFIGKLASNDTSKIRMIPST